jgi:hypothetical protein
MDKAASPQASILSYIYILMAVNNIISLWYYLILATTILSLVILGLTTLIYSLTLAAVN